MPGITSRACCGDQERDAGRRPHQHRGDQAATRLLLTTQLLRVPKRVTGTVRKVCLPGGGEGTRRRRVAERVEGRIARADARYTGSGPAGRSQEPLAGDHNEVAPPSGPSWAGLRPPGRGTHYRPPAQRTHPTARYRAPTPATIRQIGRFSRMTIVTLSVCDPDRAPPKVGMF